MYIPTPPPPQDTGSMLDDMADFGRMPGERSQVRLGEIRLGATGLNYLVHGARMYGFVEAILEERGLSEHLEDVSCGINRSKSTQWPNDYFASILDRLDIYDGGSISIEEMDKGICFLKSDQNIVKRSILDYINRWMMYEKLFSE